MKPFFSGKTRILSITFLLISLFGCGSNDDSGASIPGIWRVDSIEGRVSTGSDSHPYVKISSGYLTTFDSYTGVKWRNSWRRCTIRTGPISSSDNETLRFVQEEDSFEMMATYTLSENNLSFTWHDDGEIYHMTRIDSLPYSENTATDHPCFN